MAPVLLLRVMKKKTTVRIRENSWLARLAAGKLGARQVAMVVGHTIHLHRTTASEFLSRQRWVLHELKHVAQYEQHGTAGFLFRYLWASIRHGYTNNPFEVAARAAESDLSLLDDFEWSAPDAKNKNQ